MKWQYVQYWTQKGDYGLERINRAQKRKDERKKKGRMCKCGNMGTSSKHHCPFDIEMNWGDKLCNCCSKCRYNCAMDV